MFDDACSEENADDELSTTGEDEKDWIYTSVVKANNSCLISIRDKKKIVRLHLKKMMNVQIAVCSFTIINAQRHKFAKAISLWVASMKYTTMAMDAKQN